MSDDGSENILICVKQGTENEELILGKQTFQEIMDEVKGLMLSDKFFNKRFKTLLSKHDFKVCLGPFGQDDMGRNALHYVCHFPVRSDAFKARDLVLYQLIVHDNKIARSTDKEARTPLHYLLHNNPRLGSVQMLLEDMEEGIPHLNSLARSLLNEACVNHCHSDIISLFLQECPIASIIPDSIQKRHIWCTWSAPTHDFPIEFLKDDDFDEYSGVVIQLKKK